MNYTYTTDDQLISDVADANFRSARLGRHDDIDGLYSFCQAHDMLTQYQAGINLSLSTWA